MVEGSVGGGVGGVHEATHTHTARVRKKSFVRGQTPHGLAAQF